MGGWGEGGGVRREGEVRRGEGGRGGERGERGGERGVLHTSELSSWIEGSPHRLQGDLGHPHAQRHGCEIGPCRNIPGSSQSQHRLGSGNEGLRLVSCNNQYTCRI